MYVCAWVHNVSAHTSVYKKSASSYICVHACIAIRCMYMYIRMHIQFLYTVPSDITYTTL